MELVNKIIAWVLEPTHWQLITGIALPFVAIVVAGIIAASIGRGSAKRVIAHHDSELRFAAVTALVSGARKAAVWNTLPVPEQQHVEYLIAEADTRIRMLPIANAELAADWAAHEIADMKKNAVSFSFQAESMLAIFRDRLIEWQAHPGRGKRLFKNDMDSWAYDSTLSDQELVQQQQAWAAQQAQNDSAADLFNAPAPDRDDIYAGIGSEK